MWCRLPADHGRASAASPLRHSRGCNPRDIPADVMGRVLRYFIAVSLRGWWGRGARAMTHPLAGKRALIVEDEYLVAMNIVAEVAARGSVAVGPAATVDGALKAIKNADVDGAIV